MASVPRFCVDESPLTNLHPDAQAAIAALEPLIQLVEEVVDHKGGPPEIVRHIYEISSTISGRQFGDLLYQDLLQNDRDFALRVQRVLDRCKPFTAQEDFPPDAIVENGAKHVLLPSHACAQIVSEVSKGRGYYVLLHAVDNELTGNGTVEVTGERVSSYLLCSSRELPKAYRQLIVRKTNDEKDFFLVSDEAFPTLLFHPTVTLRKLSRSYPKVIDDLVDHLSFLNDEFIALGKRENWDLPKMMRRARISFSDESGKTRAQEKLMRLRRIFFGAVKIECTLHTKISPRTDRVHFHPPDGRIDPEKVIIGVIVDHLPT